MGYASQLQSMSRCAVRAWNVAQQHRAGHNPPDTDAALRQTGNRGLDSVLRKGSTSTCWCTASIRATICLPTGLTSSPSRQSQRLQRRPVSGDEPHRRTRRHTQLFPVSRRRQRANPSHRPQTRNRSTGSDQPDSGSRLGMHGLPLRFAHRFSCSSNTTSLGEACAVCHGSEAQISRSTRSMRNIKLTGGLALLAICALPSAAQTPLAKPVIASAPSPYAGSLACKVCHEDNYNAFTKSPHYAVETNARGWEGRACECATAGTETHRIALGGGHPQSSQARRCGGRQAALLTLAKNLNQLTT